MSKVETASELVANFEAKRARELRGRRLQTLLVVVLGSAALWASMHVSGVFKASVDGETFARMGVFIDRMAPDLRADALFADRGTEGSIGYWFYDWKRWLDALKETAQMAIIGTVFGGSLAFLLAFLAARNVMPVAFVRLGFRRLFDALRTFPDEILAIIIVAAFGFGAVSGSVALIITTVGSLGKLFSEALETADPRPVEAIRAAGGGALAQVRFGVVPQVMPIIASYGLLRLEGNLVVASALGIVGAGGIGVELQRAVTYGEFDTYLAILLMMVMWIFMVDMVSQAIRNRLVGVDPSSASSKVRA